MADEKSSEVPTGEMEETSTGGLLQDVKGNRLGIQGKTEVVQLPSGEHVVRSINPTKPRV